MDITFKLSEKENEGHMLDNVFAGVDKALSLIKNDDFKGDVLSPRLEFIPVVGNISAGDNVAFRHYYKAECSKTTTGQGDDGDQVCSEMTLKNKKL